MTLDESVIQKIIGHVRSAISPYPDYPLASAATDRMTRASDPFSTFSRQHGSRHGIVAVLLPIRLDPRMHRTSESSGNPV